MTGMEIGVGKFNPKGFYDIEFKGLRTSTPVDGLTNMANAWVFFLLSTYNPETKIGSNLTKRLKDGILYKKNMDATIIEIEDDVKDAEKRFKAFQAESPNIPDNEKLSSVKILGISIDKLTQTIKVDMSLKDINGRSAGVRV